jgi:exonuclease V gamma subunit
MDNNPKLTPEQLKKLITDHSVRENLKSLLKQAQTVSELAGKLRKGLAKFFQSDTETIDQVQLLKDLEQLRVAKHLMKGIRFVNFYQALKGEEPRHSTTEKFEAEK